MTRKTRQFVIASLVVLTVGLGSGLLAYYVGLQTAGAANPGAPNDLQFVPSNAVLVAYVDVREIIASALGEQVRSAFTWNQDGRRAFASQTGINIETDVDRVVAAVTPLARAADSGEPGSGLVLARGRFDAVKIEALVRQHGGSVEEYKGRRLIVGDSPSGGHPFTLVFLEPGLVAVGSADVVKASVDLSGGGASVTAHAEIMRLVGALDSQSVWVVGRADDLASRAALPSGVGQPLGAIDWFSASARVDTGVHAVLRAEARDEASATSLRDLIRGGLALARIQASARPELEPILRSIELGGVEKTVTLSFDVPSQLFDALGPLLSAARPPAQVGR